MRHARWRRRTGGFGATVAGAHARARCAGPETSGTASPDDEIERLRALLGARSNAPIRPSLRFRNTTGARSDVTWVEAPDLVAEVAFAEWTPKDVCSRPPGIFGFFASGPGRPSTFDPSACRCGRSSGTGGGESSASRTSSEPFWTNSESRRATHHLLPATSPRCWSFPHLRGRPFTIKRYPDGWQGGELLFQKKRAVAHARWIDRAPLPTSTRDGRADRGGVRS